jgi:hypothetical protein
VVDQDSCTLNTHTTSDLLRLQHIQFSHWKTNLYKIADKIPHNCVSSNQTKTNTDKNTDHSLAMTEDQSINQSINLRMSAAKYQIVAFIMNGSG